MKRLNPIFKISISREFFYFAILFYLFSIPSHAQNISDGQRKAASCIACHGPKGISLAPIWPNLAGQKDQYLAKQLTAFKSDERKDALMGPVAKALSEQDIKDLAAYYASLKP